MPGRPPVAWSPEDLRASVGIEGRGKSGFRNHEEVLEAQRMYANAADSIECPDPEAIGKEAHGSHPAGGMTGWRRSTSWR